MSFVFIVLTAFVSVSFANNPSESCSQILSPEGVSFPSELRLSDEKVQILLNSEHRELIYNLGRLFHQLETKPEILYRLPYILNAETALDQLPAALLPEIRSLLLSLPEKNQRNFSKRLQQLTELMENDLLGEEQIQWLALLVSDLEVVPHVKGEFTEQDAEDQTTGRKFKTLSEKVRLLPKHREFFEAMTKHNGFFLEIRDLDELLHDLYSVGGSYPFASYKKAFNGTRDKMFKLVDESGTKRLFGSADREANFLYFRYGMSMLLIGPGIHAGSRIHETDFGEKTVPEFFAQGKDILTGLMEDIYFKTDLKRFNLKAYMDIMEFIYYGTPIPYSEQQISEAILSLSKKLILPAKNHANQVQSAKQAERQALANQITVPITPFIWRTEEVLENGGSSALKSSPNREKKKREKNQGPDSSSASSPQVQAVVSSVPRLLDFSKFARQRSPLEKLRSGISYELTFLRDPQQLKQTFQFTEGALENMGEFPDEAQEVIDGVLMGFTNRSFSGAGLKRLRVKTVKTKEHLYEARPNRNPYRMILRKQGSSWRVISFVHKADFDHELERVRGTL